MIVHVPSDQRLERSAFDSTVWLSSDPEQAYVLPTESTAPQGAADPEL